MEKAREIVSVKTFTMFFTPETRARNFLDIRGDENALP